LLFSAEISAQKDIYIKDAATRRPLQYVNVQSGNSGSISSESGKAAISAKSNDTVKISCVGYTTIKLTYSSIIDGQTILLAASAVSINDVLVSGEKFPSNSFNEKLDIPESAAEIYKNAVDMLKMQSTFLVKDYGNESSAKTVSSRGMSSENTIVLFNEARINDLRSGVFDFNNISINSIEEIEAVKGAEQDNTFSGAGGVIKITTGNFQDETKLKLSGKYGFDNLQSYYSGLKGSFAGINYSAFAERAYSPNNYKYSFEGQKSERKSAEFNKTLTGLDLQYSSSLYELKNYFHYSYLKSGIPGSVVNNNDGSNILSNVSRSYIDVLNFNMAASSSLYLKNTFAVNINEYAIYDPERQMFYPLDKKTSSLTEFQMINSASYEYEQISLSAGNFIQHSKLKDNSNINTLFQRPDTYNRLMDKVHLSAGYLDESKYALIKDINYFAWGSYSFINEKTSEENNESFGTYKFGASFRTNTDLYIKFMSSYSNDSREPSYSERFYSELYRYGSSILQNENYHWFDAGFESKFNLFGSTAISLTYFKIKADDKIIWVPVASMPGLQIPRNMGKIESTGIELTLKKEFFKMINLTATYVYNTALNKNNIYNNDKSYNKQLIYTPKTRFNYTLACSPIEALNINLMGYYSGPTYYTTDNVPEYSIKSYFIHDFSILYFLKTAAADFQAGFNVYNIFNKSYFIIQSYPMPLRNYSITLSMEI
jgi:outer membrane cobalamin receptor